MNPQMEIGTDEKALHINLDSTKYGTFAEIGAGQEVARRFFRVGGAAGTITKTMSAYDMTFSDAIYGSTDRYVSRMRLQKMLDHEYDLLIEPFDQKVVFMIEHFLKPHAANVAVGGTVNGIAECHVVCRHSFGDCARCAAHTKESACYLLSSANFSEGAVLH